MKKVDVIRSGSLSSIIGPSGTMKRIIRNSDYFKSRGYDISIYTHDSISSGMPNVIPDMKVGELLRSRPLYKKILTKISKAARLQAKRNILLANFYLKRSDNHQKRLINYYLSLNRTPDIVVLHSESEAYWFMRLNKGPMPKIVTFLHSDGTGSMVLSYFPCIKGRKGERHQKEMLEIASSHTDKLVFISRIARDKYIKDHPNYNLKKIGIAVNGIEDYTDEEKETLRLIDSRYSKFKYRLCCVGTINRRKGQWRVLEVLSKLISEKLNDIHLSIIGEGPQREELEMFVTKHRLTDNVSFEGAVDNSEIYKYLAENNIFVLMSDNEGLPISIIEAMRAGLPIIATNVAGIPETIDDNGFLLDLDNDALFKILDNLDKYDWDNLGKLSRQKFEKEFLFSRMAEDYCDIMDSLFSE